MGSWCWRWVSSGGAGHCPRDKCRAGASVESWHPPPGHNLRRVHLLGMFIELPRGGECLLKNSLVPFLTLWVNGRPRRLLPCSAITPDGAATYLDRTVGRTSSGRKRETLIRASLYVLTVTRWLLGYTPSPARAYIGWGTDVTHRIISYYPIHFVGHENLVVTRVQTDAVWEDRHVAGLRRTVDGRVLVITSHVHRRIHVYAGSPQGIAH